MVVGRWKEYTESRLDDLLGPWKKVAPVSPGVLD